MCGIVGLLSDNKNIQEEKVLNMNNSIFNRGPDFGDIWISRNKKIGLGHRRLSIIDVSTLSNQPLLSDCHNHILVFNGEIYNYKDIKKDLEKHNIKFKSTGDSEVLLNSLIFYGVEKTLNIVNGMFSFAYLNIEQEKLYLAKDRIGKKPLYYTIFDDEFYFASELKAITKVIDNLNIDYEAINSFLLYNYIQAPKTSFKNVYQLEPGSFLTLNIKNITDIKISKYWDIVDIARKNHNMYKYKKYEDIEKELEDLLIDSIKIRLNSDVPFGLFLSGGIDSSLVAAIGSKIDPNIKTYSIGFEDIKYDESSNAKKIAKYLNLENTIFKVDEKDFYDKIKILPEVYDEPFSDQSSIATLVLSDEVSNHVKMVLTGDGGDEFFGGYRRYFQSNLLQKLPVIIKQSAGHLLKEYSKFVESPKLYRLSNTMASESLNHSLNNLVSVGVNSNLLLNFDVYNHKFETIDNFSFVENAMLYDQQAWLNSDVLTKVDRATMNYGIEARSPLLDYRIIELSWKIPLKYKVNNSKGKFILRNILKKYLPDSLIDNQKKGFSIPLEKWLKNELNDDLKSVVEEFDQHRINDLKKEYHKFINNKYYYNSSQYLWSVYLLKKFGF